MSTPQTQVVWLLRNKVNPFPVMATLTLDGSRLSLTLPPAASETFHGWVAERLGRDKDDLTATLKAGGEVQVFATDDWTVTWPKSFAGAAMEITVGEHQWLACLAYLSGGGVLQTMNLFKGRGRAKAWKKAFAALGK